MTQPNDTQAPTANQAAAALLQLADTPASDQSFLPRFPAHEAATTLRPTDPGQLSLLLSTADRVLDAAIAQTWMTLTTGHTGSEELDDILAHVADRAAKTAAQAARTTLVNHMTGTALIRHPRTISPALILPATAAAIGEAQRVLSAALTDATASIADALTSAPHLARNPAKGRQALTDLADALVATINSDLTQVLELLQMEPQANTAPDQERLAAD